MKKTDYIALWDLYGALLTKTQYEICSLYFNYDLTVSEISVEKNVTRQAVSDCLKGCERQLLGYEEKLKFLEKLSSSKQKTKNLARTVENWAKENGTKEELLTLLKQTEED